jgi:hypothetical protein
MHDVLARLEILELKVAELRAQLAMRDNGGSRAMRHTHVCPACGGRSLIHFKQCRESAGNSLIDLALDHDHSVFWGTTVRGALEAYACRRCRLVEWYARDFEGVAADGERVVFIEPEPEGAPPRTGPFR